MLSPLESYWMVEARGGGALPAPPAKPDARLGQNNPPFLPKQSYTNDTVRTFGANFSILLNSHNYLDGVDIGNSIVKFLIDRASHASNVGESFDPTSISYGIGMA